MEPESPAERPIVEIGAPDVDVAALVGRIRAEVARKIEEGVYPPELLSEVELRPDATRTALDRMRAALPFHPGVPVVTEKPVLGPPLTFGKRVVRRGLKWYTVGLIAQFEAFAAATTGLAESLIGRVEALERETARLRRSSSRLQREQAAPGAEREAGAPHPESPADDLALAGIVFGTESEVAARRSRHVDAYRDAPGPVVDLACLRGEFLDAARAAGVDAYGVARSGDLVARCRERGLLAEVADPIDHLRKRPPGSLGGVYAANLVERLDTRALAQLLDAAAEALAPGAHLVLESINPGNLAALAAAAYRDPAPVRPLHPETLKHLVEEAGFRIAEIDLGGPTDGLLAYDGEGRDERSRVIAENFERINRLLFGPEDFAIIATR